MFEEYYKERIMNYTNMQLKAEEEQSKQNQENDEKDNETIKKMIQPIVIMDPQSNMNYVEKNKQTVSKINNMNKNKKEAAPIEKNPYHKEYGKTPKYIQDMKLQAEIKKQNEKLKKEESKYPKGTRLLSEEERMDTLDKLKQSKKEIVQILEKLPITHDTQAFRNKKEELYRRLDELDSAIEKFSRKKVFVKID